MFSPPFDYVTYSLEDLTRKSSLEHKQSCQFLRTRVADSQKHFDEPVNVQRVCTMSLFVPSHGQPASLPNDIRKRLWAPDKALIFGSVCKHLFRRLTHRRWNLPSKLVVCLHEPQQVAALIVTVRPPELLTRVQDAKVVEKLHIASSELKLEALLVRNPANNLESILVARRQRPQRAVARIALRSQKGADPIVANEIAVLLQKQGSREARILGSESTAKSAL